MEEYRAQVMPQKLEFAMRRPVLFLLTVNGELMEIGLNVQRVAEAEPKFEPEKSKFKQLTEESSAMEPTLMLVFAMNSRAQFPVYGMTTVPGVNVTRIVMVELSTELDQFTKKHYSEVHLVKEGK